MSLDPGFTYSDTTWLTHNVLPRNELVLLDGAPGVGKSCLAASLVASLCRSGPLQPDDSILYLLSNKQLDLTQRFLQRHEPDYSRIKHVEYQNDTNADSWFYHLIDFVRDSLQQHKPVLLIIDSIEEFFAHCPVNTHTAWQNLYVELRNLADDFNCTILVPRRHGLHESRAYGHFARAGSAYSRFILTLHYHPIDPLARILTLAKNQTGPIGSQMLARFTSNQMSLELLEPHQHVKPARAPATWRSTDPHQEETETILETVEDFMQGHPKPKKAVKEHVLSQGFSERAYIRFLTRAKIPTSRLGTPNWHFLPNGHMFYRSPRGQAIIEKQLHSPLAPTPAGDQTPVKPADINNLKQAC